MGVYTPLKSFGLSIALLQCVSSLVYDHLYFLYWQSGLRLGKAGGLWYLEAVVGSSGLWWLTPAIWRCRAVHALGMNNLNLIKHTPDKPSTQSDL